MKLKAKGNNNNSDAIIEKFSAQSSKSAKFAKSSIKKREVSEAKNINENKKDGGSGGGDIINSNGGGSNNNNNANSNIN